jgi:hypothetical protein
MLTRTLPAVLFACAVISACAGDDDDATPTPQPITSGPALQIFLREAYDEGLFEAGDPIQLSVEELLYDDAARKASELGLGLYSTVSGTPPYPDGLPGFLITAQGDFFDYSGDGESPSADTPRRTAVATAFVDKRGRFTYAWRFTETQEPTEDSDG